MNTAVQNNKQIVVAIKHKFLKNRLASNKVDKKK